MTVVERVEDQALAGLDMAQMTPQVSELLEKALEFSTQERGLLAARLIDSLDDAPASAVNRVGKGHVFSRAARTEARRISKRSPLVSQSKSPGIGGKWCWEGHGFSRAAQTEARKNFETQSAGIAIKIT